MTRDEIIADQVKQFEDLERFMRGTPPPPIPGAADVERESRLDAERVTLEFAQKSTRRLDSGERPIEESPLFGGDKQEEMF